MNHTHRDPALYSLLIKPTCIPTAKLANNTSLNQREKAFLFSTLHPKHTPMLNVRTFIFLLLSYFSCTKNGISMKFWWKNLTLFTMCILRRGCWLWELLSFYCYHLTGDWWKRVLYICYRITIEITPKLNNESQNLLFKD